MFGVSNIHFFVAGASGLIPAKYVEVLEAEPEPANNGGGGGAADNELGNACNNGVILSSTLTC